MDKNWMDNLRERMENHTEQVPNNLWEAIEQRVAEIPNVEDKPKKHKTRLYRSLYIIGAVAAAVLFVWGGIKLMYTKEKVADVQTLATAKHTTFGVQEFFEKYNALKEEIEKTARKAKKERIQIQSEVKENVNKNKSKVTTNQKKKTTYKPKKIAANETNEPIKATDEQMRQDDGVAKKTEEKVRTENNPKQKNVEKNKDNKEKFDVITHTDDYKNLLAVLDSKKRTSDSDYNRWSASTFVGNSPTKSSDSYLGYGRINQGAVLLAPDLMEGVDANPPLKEILMHNQSKITYTDVDHKQPISVGVTLNWSLHKKWSVSTGINYSLLLSKLKSGSKEYFYNSNQTLHFIGIPLNVNYAIWQNRSLMCYVSVGAQVQKMVYGKLVTDYISGTKPKKTERESVSNHHLYWSAQAAAGIQYKISDQIGLYLEPSLNYYFKNNSLVETIYKDKRYHPGLKIGLKFTFQ